MLQRETRLFVLPPSHYCERARWALDHIGFGYTEVRWAVGPHALLARRIAGGTALPIFDTGTKMIQGSGRILDWTGISGADPTLEARFEISIGVLVRQYLYAATLGDSRSGVSRILFDGVSGWQASLGRLAWPVTRRMMILGMNARVHLVAELEQKLSGELDWFERALGTRPYLVDDRFGRADITAASLLAPLARPVACPLYRQAVLPPAVENALMHWSGRPALKWATHIYAEHRA